MKNNAVPMRRCVGCMESKEKSKLVRIAGFQGAVNLDSDGKAPGRGVYLCKNTACLEQAMKKRALAKSLKMEISAQRAEELMEELRKICETKC